MSMNKEIQNPKYWGEADSWIVNTPHGRKTRKEIHHIIKLWSKDTSYIRLERLLKLESVQVLKTYLERENAIPKEVGERVGEVMKWKKVRHGRSRQYATCRVWKKGKLDCNC